MLDLVNYYGASGAHYEFQLAPIGAAYRPIPGVYIFVKQMPDRRWLALYVGETGDFDERLNTGLQRHHAWPNVCSHQATHICTLAVPGPLAERLRIETDLRHALNPSCNQQAVPAHRGW